MVRLDALTENLTLLLHMDELTFHAICHSLVWTTADTVTDANGE
jgi:hypothetical protein